MRIGDLLARKQPVFSFEFFPPKSDEAAAQLERTIAELVPLAPDFVSVTYGAGGSTREKTIDIVTRIKRETGLEAMAHLTCVGSTMEELDSVLQRLTASGVENVLALRGDPQKDKRNSRQRRVASGTPANSQRIFVPNYDGKLSVGGAAYPEKHVECANPAVDLNHLRRKVDNGAEFLITQLFFDNHKYFEFVDNARAMGITVP